MATWTVIDEQSVNLIDSGDELRLDPGALGWERKPEGLCREEVCIPVPSDTPDGPLEAALLARLLGRALVIDADERVAAFGASAHDRAAALRSGMAPDFEIPDVDGVLHRLSDYRGRKVVLYAYASW